MGLILLGILFLIIGNVVPYLCFTVYYNHVKKNHYGGSDSESLEEGAVFGLGYLCIAFIPIGAITIGQSIFQ